MISQFLLFIGCVLILHAAYSLQHYRSLVQDLIESSTGISIDVDAVSTTMSSSSGGGGDRTTPTAVLSSTVPQFIEPTVTYRIPPLDIYVELAIAFIMLLVSEFLRSGSSMQRAVSVRGEKTKPGKPVIGAPFISRDFDIYTTRKAKLH